MTVLTYGPIFSNSEVFCKRANSSSTKLYSHVLRTVAPQVHSATQRKPSVFQQPSKSDAQSSIIIETIKNEINRSHDILLERIMQLELKRETVHEQQAILKSTIETQVLPSLATVSELFADVCQQLVATKIIKLSDQQQIMFSSIHRPPPMQTDSPASTAITPCSIFSSSQQKSSSFFPMTPKLNANNTFPTASIPTQ